MDKNFTQIRKADTAPGAKEHILIPATRKTNLSGTRLFSATELDHIKNQQSDTDVKTILIQQYVRSIIISLSEEKKEEHQSLESWRKAGSNALARIQAGRIKEIKVLDVLQNKSAILAFTEGMMLGNYQFLKYKKDKKKERHSLENILLNSKKVSEQDLRDLQVCVEATCIARSLVNEPVIFLNAEQLAKEARHLGKESGFSVEVFNKAKINALKMGGLLAVNSGSIDPPTFSIMEWKPAKAKNKKPYVLVGKGVVYDTGGLSLKPTPNSMDTMKCDMAGAAAVICTMYAVAKAKLPVHVIGLVPATDNRPSGNAYTPGDVITMHSGLTVEVLNTDAEGRMILADALSYAQKYDPELVIDLATLTGAAAAAIGKYGIVGMGTAGEKAFSKLKESGKTVYERIVEMPFWEEYDELIRSSVAEIKNIGGPVAGAITAGKFLEHFTNYPWIHLDIAGPAFISSNDHYKPQGGTGVGVRLLFDFFKKTAR